MRHRILEPSGPLGFCITALQGVRLGYETLVEYSGVCLIVAFARLIGSVDARHRPAIRYSPRAATASAPIKNRESCRLHLRHHNTDDRIRDEPAAMLESQAIVPETKLRHARCAPATSTTCLQVPAATFSVGRIAEQLSAAAAVEAVPVEMFGLN